MAAGGREAPSMMMPSRMALLQLICLCFLAFHGVEGQCTIPEDLRGTWVDSVKGSLEFSNHTITGYDIFTFGQFSLTCYHQNDSTYIFESNSFFFFSLNFTGYLCWSFTKVNDNMYYFYEHTEELVDAGYEKVKMYLPFSQRVNSDVCFNTNPGLGSYRILYRNDTLSSSLASARCPSLLQKLYTFDINMEGSSLCSGTSSLDGCSSASAFGISASNCSTNFAYSAGGSVSCLLDIVSESMTYMTLVNNDATVDNNSTFTFTCMMIDSSTSPYLAAQYPTQCPDSMNITNVTSPGAYLTFTFSGECPTETTSYLWVIGVVLALILLIAIVVFVILYRKKRQDSEMKRKLELERAEDDTRYTEDENFNTRGKYPPNVTIAIMEGRSRGMKDMGPEDKEKGTLRTTGEVTPSGIQPSYDGPHRKFSKRRRVWVIGEDGNVVKEYKESKDGRDSPDSGVEDEEERGEKGKKKGGLKSLTAPRNKEGDEETGDKGKTKTGVKFVSVTKDKGGEQEKDFQKQYGRQDVKEAGELTERGDMSSGTSKLFSKIKRMAGIKSFAMARKKRNRGAKSAKMYKHKSQDDGEGHSSGSNNDDHDDDDANNENMTRVVELKPGASGPTDKKKGGKKSDKGRDSPDSGTGRDSALSSHSSSSSSSSSSSPSANNDKSGGGAGGVSGSGNGSGGTSGGDGSSKRSDSHKKAEGGNDKSRSQSGQGHKGPQDSVDWAGQGRGRSGGGLGDHPGGGGAGGGGGGRVSRSRSDKSGLSGLRSPPGLVSRSSGYFGSEDGGQLALRDVGDDQFSAGGGVGGGSGGGGGSRGGGGGAKGEQSGSHVTGSGAETKYYGAGQDSVIQVTPRGDGKNQEGGGSNGKGKRNSQARRKREDSTISAIDLTGPLDTPVESSRPPTGHQRRHGWQEDDSSRSPSRSRSRSPGERERRRQASEDKDPAPSERTTDSRSVRWQGEGASAKSGTAGSGRRSVRWQDGNSQGDSLMIPLTSGMGIRRYPDSESGAATPSRENRAYSSMSRLARLHKKKKAVAPLLETPEMGGEGGRQRIQRPPDMDDLEWRRLLEELYPDKKYLDYAKATSEKESEGEAFVHSKADQGLSYLYDRARYWKTQQPLVRPGTSMSIRSVDSRAPSTIPPSSRGAS